MPTPPIHTNGTYTVQASNLCFQHSADQPVVLNNISFTLGSGQMLCIGGVNGTGKSTLLALLASIFVPTQGSLLIHNVAAAELVTPAHIATRRLTTLLLQDADMQIIGSTVAEDMLIGTFDNSIAAVQQETLAYEMAEKLGLAQCWNTPTQQLSYGQKRKLCLATALLRNPKLLLLDEPLNGLDYPAALELLHILQTLLNQGTSIIATSHDLEIMYPFAHNYLFLHPSLPMQLGSARQLFPLAKEYGIRPPHAMSYSS